MTISQPNAIKPAAVVTAAPKRIQRKRAKGWRMPENTVSVTRPGRYGNPFTIGCEAWRFSTFVPFPVPESIEQVLDDYRYYLSTKIAIIPDFLDPLKGMDLACFCKLDQPCHADILLELANE